MLPLVAVANSPPRNSVVILDRGRAPSCYKHASGNQSSFCSRTHAFTAAQNTAAPHQACSAASHAPTICGDKHAGFEPALQPSHSLEEQDHSQPSAFPFEQQSASHKQQQQQQHAQKQQPLSWNVTVSYNELTKLVAAASVVPALLLAMDALVLVLDGNLASTPLAPAAAWQGPLRDLFSFTVLLSVFITCEPGAAAASAVSATGAALQMLSGPTPPPLVACCTAAALIATALMVLLAAGYTKVNSNTLGSRTQSNSKDRKLQLEVALRALQQVLGVLGGGLLAQFLTTLAPSASPPAGAAGIVWWLPVTAGAVAVLLAGKLIAASNNKKLMQLWADWPAWSATLLLILQPLQQLVELSLQPLQPSISAHQQLLLVLASGLMVPRALVQRELMWFTGTFCGASLSAGQLAVCATQHWTQEWGSTAGLADMSRGPMMTMTVAALLLICALLKAGWQHILAPANGSTTEELQCDVGCMVSLGNSCSLTV